MNAKSKTLVALVALLMVGGLTGWWFLSRTTSVDERYVTAAVTQATITATLSGSGPLERVTTGKVSFPAAGKVTGIKVAIGDQVAVGQELATMETTELVAKVDEAEAALAQAKDVQASAEQKAGMTEPTVALPKGNQNPAAIVGMAQRRLNLAWGGFSRQLAAASLVCSAPTPPGPSPQPVPTPQPTLEPTVVPTPSAEPPTTATPSVSPTPTEAPLPTQSPSPSPTATPTPTAFPSPTELLSTGPTPQLPPNPKPIPKTGPAAPNLMRCTAALTALQRLENEVTQAKAGLDQAIRLALSAPATTVPSIPKLPAGSSPNLTQAKAAVVKAELDLTNAQLALKQATLTAPIAGVVSAQPFTIGHDGAGQAITIIGPGAAQVTIPVSDRQVIQVKIGQKAQVTSPTGSVSSGTVSSIGLLPEGAGATPSYPVTIHIAEPDPSLAPGVVGAVDVTVAEVRDAIIVPVSAVTMTSTQLGTVTELRADGSTFTHTLWLGVLGATHIQVEGLQLGQRVVLADRELALPSANFGSEMGPPGQRRQATPTPEPTPRR